MSVQAYKTKQRNYKRNGDVIADVDQTKTITNNIGYSLNVSVTGNPWSINRYGYLTYSEDTNFDTMTFDEDGNLVVQYNPYLYITVDSTPFYLIADVPNDIDLDDLIIEIDDYHGILKIIDTRI